MLTLTSDEIRETLARLTKERETYTALAQARVDYMVAQENVWKELLKRAETKAEPPPPPEPVSTD